jgi:hypothetical protein
MSFAASSYSIKHDFIFRLCLLVLACVREYSMSAFDVRAY